MSLQDYKIGDSYEVSKTISESDVYLFAGITGDLNPAHVNKVKAEEGVFGQRVVHGILTSGLISNALASMIPGSIYVSQQLNFTAPVFFGDTVTARIEVKEYFKDRFLKFETIVTNQDGKEVITGEALLMPPKK
uniref:MaoC family dehydratase n=1 Tax=Anaerococcus mediterraneensis TaxID=1870984 RepID=UPI0009F80F04|nr:MaoC family dehydratase [Anaerococcus mediterraneensis]